MVRLEYQNNFLKTSGVQIFKFEPKSGNHKTWDELLENKSCKPKYTFREIYLNVKFLKTFNSSIIIWNFMKVEIQNWKSVDFFKMVLWKARLLQIKKNTIAIKECKLRHKFCEINWRICFMNSGVWHKCTEHE